MKRIGLLGGMSWQSTALYYRLLNEGASERLGRLHSADCVLVSVDFDAIAELQSSGRWDEAGKVLAEGARRVQDAGADLLLVCTNTMHKVADQIQAAVDIPLLHIADTIADAAHRAGLARVGLLATAFTMEQPFYRERLEAHGLEVIVPSGPHREMVHRIIYDELCSGAFTSSSRERVIGVVDELAGRGAEGVILGCTEIELLISQDDSPVRLLPSTRIHASAALSYAIDPTG